MIQGIDVVILAFDEESSVEAAIADAHEALDPTGVDWHATIVDDGSRDGTLGIARAIASRDPRVGVRSHAVNRGMGAACRTGFEAGSRPYVTMLPADRQVRAHVLPGMMALAGPRIAVTSLYSNRPNDALRTIASRTFRLVLRAALGPTPVLEGTYVVPRDLLGIRELRSESFTLGFEILKRAQDEGYEIRVATIESHLRERGRSKVFTPRRIATVLREVWTLRRHLAVR